MHALAVSLLYPELPLPVPAVRTHRLRPVGPTLRPIGTCWRNFNSPTHSSPWPSMSLRVMKCE